MWNAEVSAVRIGKRKTLELIRGYIIYTRPTSIFMCACFAIPWLWIVVTSKFCRKLISSGGASSLSCICQHFLIFLTILFSYFCKFSGLVDRGLGSSFDSSVWRGL